MTDMGVSVYDEITRLCDHRPTPFSYFPLYPLLRSGVFKSLTPASARVYRRGALMIGGWQLRPIPFSTLFMQALAA